MIAFLGIPRELFSQMISDLVKQGKIVQEGESISIATHKPKTTAEQEAMISNIKRLFEQNPSNPPTFKELITNISGSEKIVRFMCRQNMLMEFDDGILLEPQYYQKIKNDVVTFLKENGQITIQDFHSITGFSRKYTIPILAYMDKERITKREGERRVLC
jgi:selenocysteine-specific elongation factor